MIDEHGTVLLTVRGLQMGTGASESSNRDRLLGERLLTIEWQPRELPAQRPSAGKWLLVSTSDDADLLATTLTDAFKLHDARCDVPSWPAHVDHAATAERFAGQPARGRFRRGGHRDAAERRTRERADPDRRTRTGSSCCAHRPGNDRTARKVATPVRGDPERADRRSG